MHIVYIQYVNVYYMYAYTYSYLLFTSLYTCIYEMHVVVYLGLSLCSQQINIK